MNDSAIIAAEIAAQRKTCLEVLKASKCPWFRYSLELHGELFKTRDLSAEKAADLFPQMVGNLYIHKLEGFNVTLQEWETI